jgi:hypothetical protein
MDVEGNQGFIPGKVKKIFSKTCDIDCGNHPASIGTGRQEGFRRRVKRLVREPDHLLHLVPLMSMYSSSNSTKSPASGAGNVSEPRLMSIREIGRSRVRVD